MLSPSRKHPPIKPLATEGLSFYSRFQIALFGVKRLFFFEILVHGCRTGGKMIPDFSLPSNPEVKIEGMRTATVADMLDFCEIEELREEVLLTKFLNRVQSHSDSKNWTGEDRLFSLFWYFIHTEAQTQTIVSYDCDCGKKHTETVDYKLFGMSLKHMDGKPERTFPFEGETVTIKPLTGEQLERLEGFSIVVGSLDKNTGEYRRKRAELDLLKLIMISTFGNPEDHEADSEARIKAMDKHQFIVFASHAGTALREMEHGLDSEYRDGKLFLLTPGLACPEKEGRRTKVLLPFRCSDFLPSLFS